MALIIEDGTGKADAQSYASVTELRAYAELRGSKVPGSEEKCEQLLIKAMDYLEDDNQVGQYVGEKWTKAQALKWPRYGVVIENFPFASTEIPRQLIQAQCALAIEAQTVDLQPTVPVDQKGAVIRESIAGAIDIAYEGTGRVRNVPAIAKAQALLSVLLRRSGLQIVGTRI